MKTINNYINEALIKKDTKLKSNIYCLSIDDFCKKYNIKKSRKQVWGTDFYNTYYYDIPYMYGDVAYSVFLSSSKKDFLDYNNVNSKIIYDAQNYIKENFNLSEKILFNLDYENSGLIFTMVRDDKFYQYIIGSFIVNYGYYDNLWKYHYSFVRESGKDINKIQLNSKELNIAETAFITYLDYMISNHKNEL